MKTNKNVAKKVLAGLAGLATLLSVGAVAAPVSAAPANNLPDVMLAAFWRPASDHSNQLLADSLYMSTDGQHFQLLDEPFVVNKQGHVNGFPTYVQPLHDPGLFYTNGSFWMISGFTSHKRFIPMMSSSRDLVHWSDPNSGSKTNLRPTTQPAGSYNGGNFDDAGPDAMSDGNGSVWIVTPLGYWGGSHGRPEHDTMHPYIVHATGVAAGANRDAQPIVHYGPLKPINLPQRSSNWIDPSLWKEGNTYYLSIKKNGIQNQIYSTRNPYGNSWKLVCNNVVTGFEGPSLAKFHGKYMMYTDKLADYPMGHANGKTGVFVTTSNRLSGGWSRNRPITAVDSRGRRLYTRHGSVLVVTDPALKQIVWNLARSKGYDYFPDVHMGDWFKDAVDFVSRRGIMTGEDGRFYPNATLDRETAATTLWKKAGRPTPASHHVYNDESRIDVWARQAIDWAAEQGVMNGNNNFFDPKRPLHREEAAKIIAVYCGQKAYQPSQADEQKFMGLPDQALSRNGELRRYSVWAFANGVINGDRGHFNPQGTATRAQFAQIVMNAMRKGLMR